MTDTVLAIFGPTASGKTAVAQAVAERIPAELVSADSMQVYRGLPILTNQSPARLVGIWHARPRGLRRRVPAARTRCDRRDPRVGTHADRRRRDGPLSPGGAGRPVASTGTGAGRARAPGTALRRGGRRERARADSPSSTPRRQPPSIRTTAAASSAASSSPGRSRERNRLWTDDTRHPTLVFGLDVPKGGARPADRRADESHVRSRRPRGGGARSRRPGLVDGAPTPTASSDIAEHPDDEDAIEALTAAHEALRRVPAQMDATHTRPC